MTIGEIKDMYDGEFADINVFEWTDSMHRNGYSADYSRELDDTEYSDDDEALDYDLMDEDDYNSRVLSNVSVSFRDMYNEGDQILCIKVQPKRVVRYIHVGASAPRYAINSIKTVRDIVTQAATELGFYEREESDKRDYGVCDIILSDGVDDSDIAEIFRTAKDYGESVEELTGISIRDDMLSYDAATAEAPAAQDCEETRNW